MFFEDLLLDVLKRTLDDSNYPKVEKAIRAINGPHPKIERLNKREMADIVMLIAEALEKKHYALENMKSNIATLFPPVIKHEGKLYYNDEYTKYKNGEFLIKIRQPTNYKDWVLFIPVDKIIEPTQKEIDSFEKEVKYIYEDRAEWEKDVLNPPINFGRQEPDIPYEERYCEKCMQTPCMCSDPNQG